MNRIAFLYGAETRRLKKIIHKTRDRDLCRRANAVLLVLKGKTKSEVASLLQAGRSSLNRWLKWYDAAGVDGLKTKRVGRPVRQNRDFICGVLKILLKYTPRTVGGERKTSDLFIALLERLKGQYRRAKSIRLIVDNYIIHKSKKTQKWLNDNPKFKLLFLPVYSLWHNKIEKLWHSLHETIPRNHQCKNMDDLLEQVYHFSGHCRTVSGRQAWVEAGVSQLGSVI